MLAHNITTGTATAIAAAYAVVKTAKGRELVIATFVDTALTAHTRLLSRGAIANLLLAMDDRPRGTNPFDSAQVLQNIISKGNHPGHRVGDARHSTFTSERNPCEVGHVLQPRDRGI